MITGERPERYQYCGLCGQEWPGNERTECPHCSNRVVITVKPLPWPVVSPLPIGWVRLVGKVECGNPPELVEKVLYVSLAAIQGLYPHGTRYGFWKLCWDPGVPPEFLDVDIPDADLPGVLADIRRAQEELRQKGGRL